MKSRNLFVLASLAVLASSATFADTANVTVYGTLNAAFESVKATGATNGNDLVHRFRVSSNSSNIGFKGSEDLGENLKAIFQLESDVKVDTGGGTWNIRNAGLGLSGSFGTAIIGNWDTPFKVANSFTEPFYSTGIGYMAAITDLIGRGSTSTTFTSGSGNTPTNLAPGLSFSRRQGNSLQYWSPAIAGLSFRAAYSTNVDRSASSNPDLFGGSVTYAEGPLTAAFAYEQHDQFGGRSLLPYGGTVADTKDVGLKGALGFKFFETLSLGFTWTNLSYKANTDAGSSTYKRDAFALTAMQKMDAWTFRLGVGTAGEGSCTTADASACSTDNLGAKLAALGASYSIGKRTDLYGIFSKIWNQSAANYNFAVASIGSSVAGADPMGAAIGVRHSF